MEPVTDPTFWERRLKAALYRKEIHRSVFNCPADLWKRIEDAHRAALLKYVLPCTAVLDAGCGYGALLDAMPEDWCGDYVGIDLSPDLVSIAQLRYPQRRFIVGRLESFRLDSTYDLAIVRSVKPMVIRNCGAAAWESMERNIRAHASRVLYLEYDPNGRGTLA